MNSAVQPLKDSYKEWFNGIISTLQTDQFLLEEGVANRETSAMYKRLVEGTLEENLLASKRTADQYFVVKILSDYLKALDSKLPNRLAFDLDHNVVLAWAEIEEGDESQEDRLLLINAEINARYSDTGFHLKSTIVESCDGLSIPPHYRPLKA